MIPIWRDKDGDWEARFTEGKTGRIDIVIYNKRRRNAKFCWYVPQLGKFAYPKHKSGRPLIPLYLEKWLKTHIDAHTLGASR